MEISFNLPVNGVSFGQVSIGLLRESFKRGESPSLFPIGEVDYSSQSNISKEFEDWIKACIDKGKKNHSRDIPCLKLWHLNGSQSRISKNQLLYTLF